MKRFRFKLQNILNFREFKRHEAEIALKNAISIRDEILLRVRVNAQKKTRAIKNSNIELDNLIGLEYFLLRLDIEKEKLLHELTSAELVVDEKRKKYVKAYAKEQVIKKLKNKRFQLWRKDFYREEDFNIDDLVASDF